METKNEIKIKISTDGASSLVRQTPNESGAWKNCRFFINEPIEKCDWWVVFEGVSKSEQTICPVSHTILITGEPSGIKKYPKKFLNQFATVITSQRNIHHRNPIFSQQALPWFVGYKFNFKERSVDSGHDKNYDELKGMISPEKTKKLSIVVSNKKNTPGHEQRMLFVQELQEHFKDRIDIFGRGHKEISDKWDGLAPYQYTICIENGSYPDYWTEKLSDAYLAGSYPFYYGCTNINKYFPKGSYTEINIKKPDEAIALIEKTIQENTYEKSMKELAEAKNLCLDTYNIFPVICDFVNKNKDENKNIKKIVILPERNFKTIQNFLQRIKNSVKKIIRKNKRNGA